jgi:ATP-dependent Clp protease ATP-binding subunit ClpB
MNFQKFTIKSQEAIQNAQEIASSYDHQAIEPVHLLGALVQDSEGVVATVLRKIGVNLDYVKLKVPELLGKLPKVSGTAAAGPYIGQDLQKIFSVAVKEAGALKDEFVSTEHLLLAMVKTPSAAGQLLADQGVSGDHVYRALKEVRGKQRVTDQTPEEKYRALSRFSRDLNELASNGKLDPVIGRDEEIRRVLQVLSRRTKNNPVLIGEPGVGKTAVAEGIAQRIVQGDVPENLKSKRIVAMDIGSLVAGTGFRGQFEERIKAVLKEVTDSEGEIILFIDELHTLVGAGAAQGAVDAANMLKPALAKGDLRAIGATTIDEYRKYIEKDPALERRFQQVLIGEPSVEDTISILRGLNERYEVHHGVRITDGAIVAAAQLGHRYISDRFLPDKAIDLVDEAASKLRIEIDSMPGELDEVERRIKQLEIEREAVSRESDGAAKSRLELITGELADLNEQRSGLRAHWQTEKEMIGSIRAMKGEIERARVDAEKLERQGELARVAELRYGTIGSLERRLKEAGEKLAAAQREKKMLKEEVDAEDIAEIVSRWTGIPVTRMLESERTKLLSMEDRLHERLVNQEDAVRSVSEAIRRSRAGLQDEKRPIGSFIFLGSTGVGKTELARALAEYLFDDENALVRIDMSEYMEKFSVSRLIGAPPGYVGYEEGGQLTEAVRRRPYSVVLLDEIEKASADVFNILLQLLDDGRLTDGQGRTVNFRNTIIIMTSNIGSHLIEETLTGGASQNGRMEKIYDDLRVKLSELLRQSLRPEFLNRIDEVILFKLLGKGDLRKIVDLQVRRVSEMLGRRGVELRLTDEAKDWLAELGHDPAHGARPLKRVIQKHVVNRLSEKILAGEVVAVSVVDVTLDNAGHITIQPAGTAQKV